MNEESLKEKIKLLEQVIDLQKQLIAAKGMAYPVYYPYIQQPLYDPWRPYKPYYYIYEPYTTITTTAEADTITVDGNATGTSASLIMQ